MQVLLGRRVAIVRLPHGLSGPQYDKLEALGNNDMMVRCDDGLVFLIILNPRTYDHHPIMLARLARAVRDALCFMGVVTKEDPEELELQHESLELAAAA